MFKKNAYLKSRLKVQEFRTRLQAYKNKKYSNEKKKHDKKI